MTSPAVEKKVAPVKEKKVAPAKEEYVANQSEIEKQKLDALKNMSSIIEKIKSAKEQQI